MEDLFEKEPLDILPCLLAHLKKLKDERLRAPKYEPDVYSSCYYHLDVDKNVLHIEGPGEPQTFEFGSLPGNYEIFKQTRERSPEVKDDLLGLAKAKDCMRKARKFTEEGLYMLDEACRDFLPESFAKQQDSQGMYKDIRLKEQQIEC